MEAAASSSPAHARGELNLVIARPALAYVEAKLGRERLEEVARASGLRRELVLEPRGWVTCEEMEHLLGAVRDMTGSDAKFCEAVSFDLPHTYGPLALVFRVGSVGLCYRVLARTMLFASRISTYAITSSGRGRMTLEYGTTRDESRLLCLSRKTQLSTVPEMFFHAPRARVREGRCVAHGDACCEYHLAWDEPLGWAPLLVGAGAGLALAGALEALGVHRVASLTALGLLAGAAFAYRRLASARLERHGETTDEVASLVRRYERALDRRAAFDAALTQRDEARAVTLERLLDEVDAARASGASDLHELSHDMRNHLQVALLNAEALAHEPARDAELDATRAMLRESLTTLATEVRRLFDIARRYDEGLPLEHAPVEVDILVARLRDGLGAVDGELSVRVGDAPAAIVTDERLLAHVLDTLAALVAREGGDVVLEVGGGPSLIAFTVRHMGVRRMAADFERLLADGAGPRALRNVARLLDELGGTLEVTQAPDGAALTVRLPAAGERTSRRDHDTRSLACLRSVVTIRRS